MSETCNETPWVVSANPCELPALHEGDHESHVRTSAGFPLGRLRWPQDWSPTNRAARRAEKKREAGQ